MECVVGGFEDDFGLAGEDGGNFTDGRTGSPLADQPKEPNPSEPSSPSKSSSPMPSAEDKAAPALTSDRPSVRAELDEIRQEQKQKAGRKKQERGKSAPRPTRTKSKKKSKGR